MLSGRDEGPVYYREIQKNAFLKRIPTEPSGKLRPLGHKKPALKPMWTLFCVHNGRTPFLEQYPDPESPVTLSHKPVWRACLRTARHVTASVKPHIGDEYDFLVDTDHGPVRMLAPDWESMQEWVTTLRNKLHELKVLSKGENVYCAPPAAPPPRAAARDPTSPLPPTPPVPPDRVPGIELNTTSRTQPEQTEERVEESQIEPEVDISNWDSIEAVPGTSSTIEPMSLTKICGQNICLDDSILKRNVDNTDSDEEFFAEVDRANDSVEVEFDENSESYKPVDYTQRVVVNDEDKGTSGNNQGNSQATNITVIKVSNKNPPHTAIPVLGPETDVFNFSFENGASENSFVNIINTETPVENGYGTVFSKESDYGHLSLTTTVNLTGTDVKPDNDSIYERLCLASTSNVDRVSPISVRRLKSADKHRKSSLPNIELASSESTYEYLYPNNNRTIVLNSEQNTREINSNQVSQSRPETQRPEVSQARPDNTRTQNGQRTEITNDRSENTQNRPEIVNRSETPIVRPEIPQSRPIVHVNLTNSISVGANIDSNARSVRSNVERSHSQNAYDASPRMRDHLIRRVQNNSPKRIEKTEKSEVQAKPIWKRGLTELSLLSRLRGIGQGKRQESPTRHDSDSNVRSVTSPVKVVHRSRAEARVDSTRRRSSSLSNGQSPPSTGLGLQPLRARQAAALRAEQRRGAAVAASLVVTEPPLFCDYDRQVWIAWCPPGVARLSARAGDRVAALRGVAPRDAHHARQLLKTSPTHLIDILFHRVPLGKIYVFNKRDHENLGIKLDNECTITSVDSQSARQAGIPPPGKWAVTEVNNRPINLIKGGEDEMNRLSSHGTEVSVLIQPAPLVKKMRAAIKANKSLLSIR